MFDTFNNYHYNNRGKVRWLHNGGCALESVAGYHRVGSSSMGAASAGGGANEYVTPSVVTINSRVFCFI